MGIRNWLRLQNGRSCYAQLSLSVQKLLPGRTQFFRWSSHRAPWLDVPWGFSLLGGWSLQIEMARKKFSCPARFPQHPAHWDTYSFTMFYSESYWCGSVCEWFRSSVKRWSLSSSSPLLLYSPLCFTVVAPDAGPTLEMYIPSIAIAMWEQTPIHLIQTATCSGLVDIHFIPGGHVQLRVLKLRVGKCTHTRWNYCCRKYGDGHLNH